MSIFSSHTSAKLLGLKSISAFFLRRVGGRLWGGAAVDDDSVKNWVGLKTEMEFPVERNSTLPFSCDLAQLVLTAEQVLRFFDNVLLLEQSFMIKHVLSP
jgi:hypothetical protein